MHISDRDKSISSETHYIVTKSFLYELLQATTETATVVLKKFVEKIVARI